MDYIKRNTVKDIQISDTKIMLLKYNEKDDIIPNFITYLIINYIKNKIDNLPTNLTQLTLECYSFNQKVDKLPKTLTQLTLYCNSFNQKIDNLPTNLEQLELYCYSFNQKIDNLPTNLTQLTLSSKSFNKKLDKLPTNVHLIFNCRCDLITNISHLSYYSNKEITYLPNTIKILEIQYYDKTLDFLPEGIEVLKLHDYKKQVNDLPSSIKEIWIKKESEHLINKIYKHKILYL